MNILWFIIAFVAGWLCCWWFAKFILSFVFKSNGSIMQSALEGLRQESLLKVRDIVEAELTKRRTT